MLNFVQLSVIFLSVVSLNDIRLSVITLYVVFLNVVAPLKSLGTDGLFEAKNEVYK